MEETKDYVLPSQIPYANFNFYYAAMRTQYTEEFITKCGYNRLLSYVNDRPIIEKHCKNGRPLFVDSGAFSAMTRGIDISMDDYIEWLNTYSQPMEKFCCWDVIPAGETKPETSAEQTWINFLYMEERVNEPHKLVYCFHYGEDVKYLRQALEHGCKEIALGGLVGKTTKQRDEFFSKVEHEFDDYDVTIHAFGMTQIDLLRKYTFIHSADSTSWLWPLKFTEAEFKTIPKVYMSDKHPEKPYHINNITDEQYFAVEDELGVYGLKPQDIYGVGVGRRNREVWQVLFWQEKFFKVSGGYFKDIKECDGFKKECSDEQD